MERIIRADNVRYFAYVNDSVCRMPAKGIVIDFKGLGNQEMYSDEQFLGEKLGALGILYIIPYLNPWNWMNPDAVKQTDEIIEAVKVKCNVQDVPLVSAGGSMGGLACLVYEKYARMTPVACVANCPVCDLPYHYTERPDLPRTLYSAFGSCNADTLEGAMRAASPLHLAEAGKMPKISYCIFHCEEDTAVNKAMHSDRFVKPLSMYTDVEYIAVPGRGHCDLGEDMYEEYHKRIINAIC